MSFTQVSRAPSPGLAGVVRRYVGYRGRSDEPTRHREPAVSSVPIILNFGPALRVSGPEFRPVEVGSFLAPVMDTYAITEAAVDSHGLQVDLSPLGAHTLLGVAMSDLTDLVIPLEDLLGSAAPLLVERLHAAPDWAARFALLDRFIAARVAAARNPSPDVAWAWRRLVETAGRLPVGRLAAELGCSRRHLNARFREQVGPGPKSAARIMRFREAVRLLSADDGRRFAEIAQSCGYYDQAHLNRDFRRLAGTTPNDYLASRMPDGSGIAA